VLANTECVLGIGANLGDRERTFTWALEQLGLIGEVLCVSNVYENPAVGGPPQPDYLNAAIRIRTRLPPLGLLAAVQRIESIAGRERTVRWGPRTLDIDLLWGPELLLTLPTLELPHPRLLERAFALQPLVEVASSARDPRTGAEYAIALKSHRTDELRLQLRAAGPPWRWQRVRGRSLTMPVTVRTQ
jgi:2-amino-4-hydroxy-6-hydroxymethyldihydropteridine diphosphokinase